MSSSSNERIVALLVEIRERLEAIEDRLNDIHNTLRAQQSYLWKVLMMTIAGAFLLIGVKLYIP